MPKTKKKRGRPSKYKGKETIALAEEYIKECEDEIVNVIESSNSKTGRERFVTKIKVNLPKAEGLALKLDVSRDTLYEWAGEHKKFSDILERVNQLQANRVIDRSLSGDYNPTIAKLLLGKHGYHDKQEVEHTGDVMKDLIVSVINRKQSIINDRKRNNKEHTRQEVEDKQPVLDQE